MNPSRYILLFNTRDPEVKAIAIEHLQTVFPQVDFSRVTQMETEQDIGEGASAVFIDRHYCGYEVVQ